MPMGITFERYSLWSKKNGELMMHPIQLLPHTKLMFTTGE